MSLNGIIKHMEETSEELCDPTPKLSEKEREYAERIFFERLLKECPFGTSDSKYEGRVKRAVAIAKLLYKEIYG